jgi:uncharacterized iron-regulated membrane protein
MELKEKLVSSFMAFEEKIDVDSELHNVRTSAFKNFENKGFPTKKDKPFEVYSKETSNWTPGNYLYFDPETANLLAQNNYSDKTAGQKYDDLTGDIHYGWIFGWPSKIATFFGCLVAASLPITGFYIWWGRKNKNKKKNKNK